MIQPVEMVRGAGFEPAPIKLQPIAANSLSPTKKLRFLAAPAPERSPRFFTNFDGFKAKNRDGHGSVRRGQ